MTEATGNSRVDAQLKPFTANALGAPQRVVTWEPDRTLFSLAILGAVRCFPGSRRGVSSPRSLSQLRDVRSDEKLVSLC